MTDSTDQLAAELAHWRYAVDAMADLDVVASPAAWDGLEQYLRVQVRDRLAAIVAGLRLEAAQLEAAAGSQANLPDLRDRVLRLRRRYFRAETILGFYGDAIATRSNPGLAALLRGFDTLASDGLEALLRPLGIDSPPVLCYLDQGRGAAILRAGVRLWDQANPSPAAAIKLTWHSLPHPTALFHETGHQFAHLTGWTAELADALASVLVGRSTELAALWRSWASEVAADVHAFALCGWSPVPALANVVDGPTDAVLRIIPGDPHPFPLVRVLFNAALCRVWFGAGPWDATARTWAERHLSGRHGSDGARLARLSIAALGDLVDACTRQPMQALGGRPFSTVADPRRVAPAALAELARRAGPSLLTSSYLARKEPVRILAWLAGRALDDPRNAPFHWRTLRGWVATLGGLQQPATPPVLTRATVV
ncbi:hypothetical protein EV384_5400 [Micromonospora kangleipakensis]|uniref:Uncharacterized protein n=1 Tax=Micromonospora kangleipakensis TaxID=1077942 RepID=A0A4Q8BFI0_9ACTN|nr:hypothetical protein [Micromonospora kangleipakensis]RZU76724.1 hypothetical protein EV384_5400 [Micromonospora kangleipakensis]